jgi:hypothetical protein
MHFCLFLHRQEPLIVKTAEGAGRSVNALANQLLAQITATAVAVLYF